jgi:DNA helicase-2/ATP-dependent DNA helicase PcrA
MQPSLFPQTQNIPASPAVQGTARGKTIDLHQELNPAQYEAATTVDGPLLVVAGAGSGKTRTLVYRLVHLVSQGIAPDRILLLTFTRKAAQEMLWRAGVLLDVSCHRVTGGTFHAIANMLLRRYGHHLGYDANFTILDRADAEGIINILKSSLSLGGAGKRFPSKHVIINIISKAVNKSVTIEDLMADEYGHLLEYLSEIHLLREHYEQFKLEHGLMDYDDLLVNWQRLLANDPAVRQEIAQRFSHIMVDEYQDTNPIQADIVRLLASHHDNVMAVGDDSQSIYSFRGADFRNIMNFPRLFPTARIIKLEENYRSTQPILTLANAIIDQATEKYTKALYSRIAGEQKPQLFGARDETAEAASIVRKIMALQDEGLALQDMAILFRSGFHSFKLEIELSSHHIPYEKRGGLKLTESAHIKDMISYLRVLVNPYDNLSWNRILLLLDKIGPKTAQKILVAVKSADDPLEALSSYPAVGKWQAGFTALVALLRDLRDKNETPADQFEQVFAYYRPIFERIYYDDYPKRSRDLDQLRTIIAGYDNLVAFVADTALDPPELEADVDTTDRLVLSTVHSAKGLEWDTVFVINLAEGKFPHAYTLPGEQQEEERRLFYVAITRAKKRLFLSYPCEVTTADRKRVRATLTPFLTRIPAGFYESTAQTTTPYTYTPSAPVDGGDGRGTDRSGGAADHRIVRDVGLLRKGAVVTHPFFGRGEVEAVVGPRSVMVLFARHGRKTLHLDYAKLELVE